MGEAIYACINVCMHMYVKLISKYTNKGILVTLFTLFFSFLVINISISVGLLVTIKLALGFNICLYMASYVQAHLWLLQFEKIQVAYQLLYK